MAWNVVNLLGVNTSPDRDTVEAALVMVERDGEDRRITVEPSGSAAVAGHALDPRGI
jgi:hypothetical protein